MARQTYSIRLWSLPPQASSGSVFGPTVPAGFTWVIRDLRMLNTQTQTGQHVDALVLETATGVVLASTPTFGSIIGELYTVQGRMILEAGEQIQASSGSFGWSLVADGYQLTAT